MFYVTKTGCGWEWLPHHGSQSSIYRALKAFRTGDGRQLPSDAAVERVAVRSPRQAMWLLIRDLAVRPGVLTDLESVGLEHPAALWAGRTAAAVAVDSVGLRSGGTADYGSKCGRSDRYSHGSARGRSVVALCEPRQAIALDRPGDGDI